MLQHQNMFSNLLFFVLGKCQNSVIGLNLFQDVIIKIIWPGQRSLPVLEQRSLKSSTYNPNIPAKYGLLLKVIGDRIFPWFFLKLYLIYETIAAFNAVLINITIV